MTTSLVGVATSAASVTPSLSTSSTSPSSSVVLKLLLLLSMISLNTQNLTLLFEILHELALYEALTPFG